MSPLYLFLFTLVGATTDNKKYLLYDTNPGEGFNLRRDVHMRMAGLVKGLNSSPKNKNPQHEYILVLPPWGRIGYHWGMQENRIPWSEFFNIEAMKLDTPVIEFEEFLDQQDHIDHVWYLLGRGAKTRLGNIIYLADFYNFHSVFFIKLILSAKGAGTPLQK